MSVMKKVCIDEVDLQGKRVLIRVDFNVPVDEKGEVADDTRIRAALPTIRYAMEHGAKLLLASHLGRPKGRDPKFSLKPVAFRLSQLLGKPVAMVEDCRGEAVQARIAQMREGDLLMLENVRFHPEEEKNDEAFSKAMAELADIYVNDAFGAAHRAHASTEGITRFVPVAASGFLMKKELEYLEKVLAAPERPFVAILGGAKVSDKLGVVRYLLDKVDALLIGGAMAYTFLKAKGLAVGKSRVEEDRLPEAQMVLEQVRASGVAVLLPVDHVIAEKVEAGAPTRIVKGSIPDGWIGLDIGPETREVFAGRIREARMIFWNGPIGVFELPPFQAGTLAIARAVAESGALSIVGGGDSVAALTQMGLAEKVTHLSTGGGATLEFVEGRTLPGVAALNDRKSSLTEENDAAVCGEPFDAVAGGLVRRSL